jgi:hypothetical protein
MAGFGSWGMNMGGSIFNTDLGTPIQFANVYLGPSLGWQFLPVTPELFVTTPGPLIVPAFASRVLLTVAGVTPITLPSVAEWMTAQGANGLVQNNAAFDRSIWIKDLAYSASSGSPIVVQGSGTDTVDGLSSFSIVTAGQLVRLCPMTSKDGWYVS